MPAGPSVTHIPDAAEITGWLTRWRSGDEQARDRLFDVVQPQLRQLAARLLRRERPDHTLEPNAVVNELYLRPDRQPTDVLPGPRPLFCHRGANHATHPHRPRARPCRRQARRRAAAQCRSRTSTGGAPPRPVNSSSTSTPSCPHWRRRIPAPHAWSSCGSSAACGRRTWPKCSRCR